MGGEGVGTRQLVVNILLKGWLLVITGSSRDNSLRPGTVELLVTGSPCLLFGINLCKTDYRSVWSCIAGLLGEYVLVISLAESFVTGVYCTHMWHAYLVCFT
jgi:hypothetical protein